MQEKILWNEMSKTQRLRTLNYCIEIANQEKSFEDVQSKVIKRELKRIDSLVRYHGKLPILFFDNFGIEATFYYSAQGEDILDINNERCQGYLLACIQLLCQAQFRFDEKNMDDPEYSLLIKTINTIGANKLLCGMAGYVKTVRIPKELDGLY